MNKIVNQCNIYISLWCIYYLQGTLYASGSMLSQAILAVLLVISFYNANLVNKHYKIPVFFKGLNLLLVMFTLYGVILIARNQIIKVGFTTVSNYTYLKQIYISLLPIYSAYLYALKGQLTKNSISKWIFLWLITAVAQYYHYERQALAEFISNRTEITNNSGYIFLSLLPALVILNKKIVIQFAFLLCCLSFIFMSMKRGAIIVGVLAFFYFMYRAYKTSSHKVKKYIVLFSLLAIVFSVYFVMDIMAESDYFIQRIENTLEGNTSERDTLYSLYWNHFINETNILKFLFGNGANGTLNIHTDYAHNDWLEILNNQGLVGALIYVYFFVCFIKSWLVSRKIDPVAFSAIGMILLVVFMKTLFSMSYGNWDIYISLSMGYFLAISYGKNIIKSF